MTLYSDGTYGDDLYSYGLYSDGLCGDGLYSYGLYSIVMHGTHGRPRLALPTNYGLYSYDHIY